MILGKHFWTKDVKMLSWTILQTLAPRTGRCW